MKKFLTLFFVFGAVFSYGGEDVLLKTMRSELERNFKVLRRQNPPVYYLSYYIEDKTGYSVSASLGDIKAQREVRARDLNVDARAGSRALDNTHEFKGMYEDTLKLNNYIVPVENGVDAIKNILWRATQDEVKTAQDRFLKVKTNSAVMAKNIDTSDDFSSPLKPVSYYKPVLAQAVDKERFDKLLRELSSIAKEHPFILESSLSLSINTVNRYIVTSEGTDIVEGGTLANLSYNLYTRNKDGMELRRTNSYHGFSAGDLPRKEVIEADIKKDIANLRALQNAPVVEPFTGPVILKNRASGVFFHEILGHRVEGHRQKSESFGQTFTKSVGKEVVSPILSVYDDPTMQHFNGVPLRGYYVYDDDGVKAQKAQIIERGVLKGFLMGRSPIDGFKTSNGHGRKSIGYRSVSRMGNTIVQAAQSVSYDKLKELLKEEIKKQGKPYGLIIEDISGGFTMIERSNPQSFKVTPLLVYKVYPDEREDEIVRGVDIVGTPLASFNKVIAAADDYEVFNGSCGAESGWVAVSAVSPSLLVAELEVEKVNKTAKGLPLLPNPVKGEKK